MDLASPYMQSMASILELPPGGILGVMLGYEAIPEEWERGMPAIADEKFSFTEFTFKTIVESTQARAIALVERNGGRLDGEQLLVKRQQP